MVLGNGMVVSDSPFGAGYDGLFVAGRNMVQRMLREFGDDAERVAEELTSEAVAQHRRYYRPPR